MRVLESPSLLPIWAGLSPDGTIVVELLTDEDDEPLVAQIPPYRESRRLAAEGRRAIDLDRDGDPGNLALRATVMQFVSGLEIRRAEIAVEQAASR